MMCITLFNGLRFCSDCARNHARGCGEKHGTILDWIFAPYHPNPLVIKSGNGKFHGKFHEIPVLNGVFEANIVYKWWIFHIAMFDSRRLIQRG